MNEEQLLERALCSIRKKAEKREVVMYGKHQKIRDVLEKAGIKIDKIFTGNLTLLADKSLKCLPANELKNQSKKYFVIIPFFLEDGGKRQRNTMSAYGFKEHKDYIFYPEEKQSTSLQDKTNDELAGIEMSTIQTQLLELRNQLDEIKNNMALYDMQNKFMLWQAMAEKDEIIADTKKRFFMSMPKATGTLRNMQLAGVILLAKFDEACRANAIPYWISFGTLLGAVRHRGFIPWDDDTDVCMMREDAERLTKIMENDKEFYVSHIFADFDDNLNHCIQFKYRREGTPYCLDIFIYDYCSDISPENVNRQIALNAELANEAQPIRKSNLSLRKKEERYAELLNKYLEKSRKTVGTTDKPSEFMIWALDNTRIRASHQSNCAVDSVLPLKPIMFEGIELMAPCNPEKYLIEKAYGDIYSFPKDMMSHVHFRLDEVSNAILEEILIKYADILNP